MSHTQYLANQAVTEQQEGLPPHSLDPSHKKEDMSLYYKLLNPDNAHKDHKPLVDLSYLPNVLDERSYMHSLPVIKGFFYGLDLNHFLGTQEAAPYMYTHHNFDFVNQALWWANGFWMNYYIAKCGVGQIVPNNPHTHWAHNIVFGAGIVRTTLATLLAVGGSLYSYEFLYKHVPPFKIRDSSLNGWKKPWDEDQSTFLARTVTNGTCVPLALAFWNNSFKRYPYYLCFTVIGSLTYELYRMHFMPGMRLFYRNHAYMADDKEARHGTLTPGVNKTMNQDTQKLDSHHRNKFLNVVHSGTKALAWDQGLGGDNLPIHKSHVKKPNIYYNWQRDKNSDGSNKYKYRSETFDLPWFMGARMAVED